MLYLLDTNAIRSIIDGNVNVLARMENLLPDDSVIICSIVWGEILFGIERLEQERRRRELFLRTRILLAGVPCEPVTSETADYYSEIRTNLERRGRLKKDNDIWIAAVALELGAVLVTNDSDFQDMERLSVEDWTA